MEGREIVRDYLNDTITEVTKYELELMNHFDLSRCECGNFELSEDMVNNKWDIGEVENQICPSCREDE